MGILADMYHAPSSSDVVRAMRYELRRNLIESDVIEPDDADDDTAEVGLAAFDSVDATGLHEDVLLAELIAVIRRIPTTDGLVCKEMVWPTGSPEFDGIDSSADLSWPGSWVTGFDIEFRDTLAAVVDTQMAEIAQRWGGTDAVAEYGASSEVLRDIVSRLVHFARDARANGNRLYLWVSL